MAVVVSAGLQPLYDCRKNAHTSTKIVRYGKKNRHVFLPAVLMFTVLMLHSAAGRHYRQRLSKSRRAGSAGRQRVASKKSRKGWDDTATFAQYGCCKEGFPAPLAMETSVNPHTGKVTYRRRKLADVG